jgi:hypothetical protein
MGLLKELNRKLDWFEDKADDSLRIILHELDGVLADAKKPQVLARTLFIAGSTGLFVVGCGGHLDSFAGISIATLSYWAVHSSFKTIFSKPARRELPHD